MYHPALDVAMLVACVNQSLGAQFSDEPEVVFASYEDPPDLRLTALLRTDSIEHPSVVIKANKSPLLANSAAIHILAASAGGGYVPRVLGSAQNDDASLLLLERFEGSPASEMGLDGLVAVANSLSHIQLRVSRAQIAHANLAILKLDDLHLVFGRCQSKILEAFERVWFADDDSKLSRALKGPIETIPLLLASVEALLPTLIGAVSAAGVDYSIHHGDLHSGNAVLMSDGSALIYDWETGSVAHPFFSMEKLLTSGWAMDENQSGGPWGYVRSTPSQENLKRTYLGAFDGDPRVLGSAFDAAMCLAVLVEMDFEIKWAEVCGWDNGNPEWTAQLINRLREHQAQFLKPIQIL
ncbi:MAG: phosphotransferase [Armatimonadota bacterium]